MFRRIIWYFELIWKMQHTCLRLNKSYFHENHQHNFKVELKILQKSLHFCLRIEKLLQYDICDVISEKVPYCGTNSVILDQLFSYFCESIFY